MLSVIDSFTKQNLALEVDTSFPSRRVTRVLEKAASKFGKPLPIRCDKGPELTSRHFLARAIESKIYTLHIRPGKPTENTYAVNFHGRLRDECLHASWFWNSLDARSKVSAWRLDYNSQRARILRPTTEPLKSLPSIGCSAAEKQTSTRKKQKNNHAMIPAIKLDGNWGKVAYLHSESWSE